MQIGPYTLIEELACGGMAQIWLVHRVWPDGKRRSCALKLPRLSAVTDEGLLRQFVEEARLSITLRHNNIVSVFDAGMHGGLPYLVMDYIPGADLAQLVRAQAQLALEWSLETAVHVVREIAQGLDHAHDFEMAGVHQQIVHRDVASKNVMVDGTGGVFITDFGVATSIGTQTSRMHVKGTLAFMAPEHYLGRATPASDVFGLGAIFWELLAGRPFRGHLSGPALVEAVVTGAVEPIGREVPAVIQRVLDGMLHPDVSRRMTLVEVLDALEEFPSRRRTLKRMVVANFGASSRRTGLSKIHFAASKELLDTLAVVNVASVLPDGPWRTLPGQPSHPPVDFAAVPVPDTAKVDPMAVPTQVDDPLTPGRTTSDEDLRGPSDTARSDAPADPTLRILGAVAGGMNMRNVGQASEARGETVVMPARGVIPRRAPVDPDAPARVETQRSMPQHPAALVGHGGARPDVGGRQTEPSHDSESRRARMRWALFVGSFVLLVVLTGWGITTWHMTPSPRPIDARALEVAPDVVMGPPAEPTTGSMLAPSLLEPVPSRAVEAELHDELTGASSLDAGPDGRNRALVEPSLVPEQLYPPPSDPPPAPAAPKVERPKPRAPKSVPTLEFTVRRGLVGFAELRLGNGKPQVVPATGALMLRVAPRSYTIRTRIEPDGAWVPIRYTFFSGMKYVARLERSGLIIGAQGAK